MLLVDEGIVRNRLKIAAAIQDANSFLAARDELVGVDRYLWQFTAGKPILNRWKPMSDVPSRTRESGAMGKDLLSRGFKFAGSTICDALVQAKKMLNDHTVDCWRWKAVQKSADPPDRSLPRHSRVFRSLSR